MNLEEVEKKAREMLATFVDAIGLDGDFYSQLNQTPIEFGKPLKRIGQYITPDNNRLKTGRIVIDEKYKQIEPDSEFYITVLHEMLHANRNLLIFDVFSEKDNEKAYSYNNGKIEQNKSFHTTRHIDASQDILKGSIDNSYTTIKSYKGRRGKKEFNKENIPAQMKKQQIIDEALVELMATLSYQLYTNNELGKKLDVWSVIEDLAEVADEDPFGAMCEIILKHEDFELFYWMIDPIEYLGGDIHYDFFSKYTQNDGDLVNEVYARSPLNDGFDKMLNDINLEGNVSNELENGKMKGEQIGKAGCIAPAEECYSLERILEELLKGKDREH